MPKHLQLCHLREYWSTQCRVNHWINGVWVGWLEGCLTAWMNGWLDKEWIGGCIMNGWMDEYMDWFMGRLKDGCMEGTGVGSAQRWTCIVLKMLLACCILCKTHFCPVHLPPLNTAWHLLQVEVDLLWILLEEAFLNMKWLVFFLVIADWGNFIFKPSRYSR